MYFSLMQIVITQGARLQRTSDRSPVCRTSPDTDRHHRENRRTS
jgi:hypothetical protein